MYTIRWADGTESTLSSIAAIEDAARDRNTTGDVWLTSERYGEAGENTPLYRVGEAS